MAKLKIHTINNIKVLFVDDKMFDYSIDEESLRKAVIYCNENPHLQKAVLGDIIKHFVDSFSEFIGRSLDLSEINEAIKRNVI